jgi:hypothetical protein
LTDTTPPGTAVTVARWDGGSAPRVPRPADPAGWDHEGQPVGPLETTVDDARAPRGGETQRQGSQHATARTTPAWWALSSMVLVRAAHLIGIGPHTRPVRTAAGDDHAHATLSATIALVRHGWWHHGHVATSQAEAAGVQIPRVPCERLTNARCDAACMDKVELR